MIIKEKKHPLFLLLRRSFHSIFFVLMFRVLFGFRLLTTTAKEGSSQRSDDGNVIERVAGSRRRRSGSWRQSERSRAGRGEEVFAAGRSRGGGLLGL